MANPSTAHEPSMEEILASIRQIISEDGEGSPAPRAEAKETAQPQPAAREERRAIPTEEPAARAQSAPAEGEFMMPKASESAVKTGPHSASEAAWRPDPPAPERQQIAPQRFARDPDDRHLLSDHSDAAVSGAFSALAHTILAQNARTLEDLVAEMLKPMLKDWLDDNLPSLVERLVQEEIYRVSRGRR